MSDKVSRDSTVGIATGYGLHSPGFVVQVPVEARFFSSPCHADKSFDIVLSWLSTGTTLPFTWGINPLAHFDGMGCLPIWVALASCLMTVKELSDESCKKSLMKQHM
jgi:hypothetical protein